MTMACARYAGVRATSSQHVFVVVVRDFCVMNTSRMTAVRSVSLPAVHLNVPPDNKSPDNNEKSPDNNKKSRKQTEVSRQQPEESRQQPQDFVVEGEPRENDCSTVEEECCPPTKNRRILVKNSRKRGLPYTTEKTGVDKPAKQVKSRCGNSASCAKKKFQCHSFDEGRREDILIAYYSLADLQTQRTWLNNHLATDAPHRVRSNLPRKSRTIQYFLPDVNGNRIPVCRVMFLHTLDVSEKQVRTVIGKTDINGIVKPEGRGGRVTSIAMRDSRVNEKVAEHIMKFPRMESHYCRKSSSSEYLSPDLTAAKMHAMYNKENEDDKVSLSFYYQKLRSLKLKFHIPKKDACNVCETYHKNPDEKLAETYHRHTAEKVKVRDIKSTLKVSTDPSEVVASFDLEQVIYLPKSNRCEIFYKRRLSCYNFTIFDVRSKECHCFLWHEGIAGRGSNEIASCVYKYLNRMDQQGRKHVHLFSDGCSGQNKNSVVPSMMLHFVNCSNSIENIILRFFEPHHGQNEGDSVHSCVERALRRTGDLMVPSQLTTLVELCRKNPNYVYQVQTGDILDWKQRSIDQGVLRVRHAIDGTAVDWTKIRELRVSKSEPTKIGFKMSHLDDEVSLLDIPRRSNSRPGNPSKAYERPPKLSEAKYLDLCTMMNGDTPVISNPEHKLFYQSLRH